jgi:hypothetical protein
MNYILIMGIINPFWVKGLQETPVTKMMYLSKFNKGAYVSGIKVFNHLPQYIKALINNNQTYFKSTLKRFLYHHSFYTMNENYEYKEERSI